MQRTYVINQYMHGEYFYVSKVSGRLGSDFMYIFVNLLSVYSLQIKVQIDNKIAKNTFRCESLMSNVLVPVTQ